MHKQCIKGQDVAESLDNQSSTDNSGLYVEGRGVFKKIFNSVDDGQESFQGVMEQQENEWVTTHFFYFCGNEIFFKTALYTSTNYKNLKIKVRNLQ